MAIEAPEKVKDESVRPEHYGYRDGDLKIHTQKYSDHPTPFWNHDLLNPGSKLKFQRYAKEHTNEKHLKEYGKKYGKKYGKQGLTKLYVLFSTRIEYCTN